MLRRTYPAESKEVMIDCRELERKKLPSPSDCPNLLTKSGMIKQP